MKHKLQTAAITLLILLMPYMWYIEVGGMTVNFSLADVLLPVIGIFILLNIKELLTQKKWLAILYFAGLLFSLALSQYASRFNTEFLHVTDRVMLLEMVKTIVVAIYFIGAFLLINQSNFKPCLLTMSLGSVPVMAIGFSSYLCFILEKPFPIASYTLSIMRFRGTFEDPNLCALYFIIVFFVSLYNFKMNRNLFLRITLAVVSLLSLFLIVITLSRGGWIAFAGAAIIFILCNIKYTRKESFLVFFAIILLLFTTVNIDYWVQKGKITNIIIDRTQQTLLIEKSETDRIQLMKTAFYMGNDNFLTGVGKGSFPLNSNKYLGNEAIVYQQQSIPHNTMLGFYAQQGIIGLSLFLLLPVFLLVRLVKSKQQHRVYFIAIFSGLFFHSMTINIENVRFVWLILGIMVVADQKDIEIELTPQLVMKKGPFIAALAGIVCTCIFLYVLASVKLAANIYVGNGSTYEKQFSVLEPGNYIISFDIQTDSSKHSVEVFDGDTLIQRMDFRNAYGFVQEQINIKEQVRVVFKSNNDGWMKINNAYLYKNSRKLPLYHYPLLPDFLQNQLNDKGFLTYREDPSFKKEVDMSGTGLNAIHLKNVRITRHSNLSHVFEFDYQCKGSMSVNYQLDLQLEYPSLSSLLPSEMQMNSIPDRLTLSPATTTWESGKEYTTKITRILHSEAFNLFGRYYDYQSKCFVEEAYFPILYNMVYEYQELLSTGESHWVTIMYGRDKENNINMTYNGWVETGRFSLEPGTHTLTFTAQGSWLDGYSEIRIRDSYLNEISRIILDETMKDYTVEYYTDKHQEGISFVLELINFKKEEKIGDRKVLLKDTLSIE